MQGAALVDLQPREAPSRGWCYSSEHLRDKSARRGYPFQQHMRKQRRARHPSIGLHRAHRSWRQGELPALASGPNVARRGRPHRPTDPVQCVCNPP